MPAFSLLSEEPAYMYLTEGRAAERICKAVL